MVSRVYRLMDTKRIEMKLREVRIEKDSVLIRPDYMAICAADQRYYLGQRRREIMKQKLPMALIHEATGTVLRDYSGELPAGTKVALLPLEEASEESGLIKSNYLPGSKFASSGPDGFMRDIIAMPRRRIEPVIGEYSSVYVFCELLSVALNAAEAFETARRLPHDTLGIWGDGSMGFIMGVALKFLYPQSKIYLFGKTMRKLQKFSFASKYFFIDQPPQNLSINHAFECVGGTGSEAAIKQITETIRPQGCVNLLGVSENPINIDTRGILEKGLILIGNSRSNGVDFRRAAALIRDKEDCRTYLKTLISETIDITTEDDIAHAFEQDSLNDFKTVMRWRM